MAIIPDNAQFRADTTGKTVVEKGSAQTQARAAIFTMDDIAETMGSSTSNIFPFWGAITFDNSNFTWSLLSDANHFPSNISSITSSATTNGLVVNIANPDTNIWKVGTVAITPDESLSRSGISTGASFGLTTLTCPIIQNQGFGFRMNGVAILSETSYIVPVASDLSFDASTKSLTIQFPSINLTQGAGLGASNFNFTVTPASNANFWFVRTDIAYTVNGVKLKLLFYDASGTLVTPTGQWWFNRTQPWQPLNNQLGIVGPNANFWVNGFLVKQ